MALPVWGNLEKSQVDPETIEEAIARLIQAHEDDPNAHIETGESLQSHKAAVIIDHLAASIIADKIKEWEVVKLGGSFNRTDYHWWTVFESLEGLLQAISDTGSITPSPAYIQMATGVNQFSWAALTKEIGISNIFSWDKDRKSRTRVKFSADTNQSISIVTGNIDNPPLTRYIGFVILDAAVFGKLSNGSAETSIDLSFNIVAGQSYDFEIKYTAGSKAEFYIDGVLKGTISTGLPTGSVDANNILYFFIGNGEAANKDIKFSTWDFWQEAS